MEKKKRPWWKIPMWISFFVVGGPLVGVITSLLYAPTLGFGYVAGQLV